jgi:hypothetical protein
MSAFERSHRPADLQSDNAALQAALQSTHLSTNAATFEPPQLSAHSVSLDATVRAAIGAAEFTAPCQSDVAAELPAFLSAQRRSDNAADVASLGPAHIRSVRSAQCATNRSAFRAALFAALESPHEATDRPALSAAIAATEQPAQCAANRHTVHATIHAALRAAISATLLLPNSSAERAALQRSNQSAVHAADQHAKCAALLPAHLPAIRAAEFLSHPHTQSVLQPHRVAGAAELSRAWRTATRSAATSASIATARRGRSRTAWRNRRLCALTASIPALCTAQMRAMSTS